MDQTKQEPTNRKLNKNRPGRFVLIITAIAVCCAVIIYFLFDPLQYSFFLKCPLHAVTGYKCPFCGLQQMLHHLLHGQIKPAFSDNPFLFILIPYFLTFFYFQLTKAHKKHPQAYNTLFGDRTLLWLAIAAVCFGIVRNL